MTRLLLALALSLLPLSSPGQSLSPVEPLVTLSLGQVAIREAIRAIAIQTGRKLMVADSLAERPILIEVTRVSGDDLLGTIEEMTGCVWVKHPVDGWLLTQRPIKSTGSIPKTIEAIVSAIPTPLLRFIKSEVDPTLFRNGTPAPTHEVLIARERTRRAIDRLVAWNKMTRAKLTAHIRESKKMGQPLPITSLDSGTRDEFARMLVLSELSSLFMLQMLRDKAPDHYANPSVMWFNRVGERGIEFHTMQRDSKGDLLGASFGFGLGPPEIIKP